MKLIILVAVALAAVALAAPPSEIKNLNSQFNKEPEGSYQFNYENDDGSKREEVGQLKEVVDEDNKPRAVVVVRGTYTYTKEDGKTETVSYFADETGYHAEGESIPKPLRR